MKIGVVGAGVVGRATARAWIEHCDEVRVYDVLLERRTHPRDEVYESDFVFVCTPESEVEAVVRGILPEERSVKLAIRSTVPIGTTRRLRDRYGLPNLVHHPEFLTARCSLIDAQTPARNVIGCPGGPANGGAETLYELCRVRFPGVPVYFMQPEESEALKIIQNAFFACKVAFFNEARGLIDAHGLDWVTVRDALLADGRIHPSHTTVPGHHGWGFSGSCLPKDLEAFRDALFAAGLRFDVSQAALTRNVHDRGRVPPK